MPEMNSMPIQQEQFQDIMQTYGTYIYNFSLKLTTNPDDASDLLQNTFLKAWQHINELRDDKAIKYWLRAICFNEFKMWLRKYKHITLDFKEDMDEFGQDYPAMISIKPSVIDEMVMEEQVKKLRDGCFLAMTRKLTLPQRMAFSLVDMFGLTITETAGLLDITPKAVKGLLYRARSCLTNFFKDHCNILEMNNPCSCQAWMDFMKDRDKFQQLLKMKPFSLDYHGHKFDPIIYQKILSIYHHTPDKRPEDHWFTDIIQIINKS